NQAGNVVNPRDFSVMIWQDNVITQLEPVPGSNQAGVPYLVQFEAAPAVYQAGSQQTGPDDGLLIELLRDDDSIFAAFVHQPGAWNGFPELLPASFEYVG
ncbi:MAG: hypothetical protein GWO24_15355, partial [Akkermansiaceae bacterium]|nr:hypothetical protein [Akkermansiaceae bacterium]